MGIHKRSARYRTETGQMLVLFVLALGVLMGFVAMAIDVGMIYVERRSLQTAADAAALAAVQELPAPPGTVIAEAKEWAEKNGYGEVDGAVITVTTPYQGSTNAVDVVIERDVPFLFAVVLGKDKAHVSARAVASRDGGGYGDAIFAYRSGCGNPKEIDMSGANLDVTGGIHSNGDLKVTSSNVNIDGPVTYICQPPHISGSTFNASDGIKGVSETRDWPVHYEYSDFGPCTFSSNGDMVIGRSTPQYWLNDDPNTNTLKQGVYCSEGDIWVAKQAYGTVTFAAKGKVVFAPENNKETARFRFTPYQHDVVGFSSFQSDYSATGNVDISAIHISASSFEWEGILLATRGRLQFSSSDISSPSGSAIADTVKISASKGTIVGLEGDSGLGPPRLVE